jgi:hypothetical protein
MAQSDLLKLGAINTAAIQVQKFLAKLNTATTLTTGGATITFTRAFDSSIFLSTGLYGNATNTNPAFTWDSAIQNSRLKMRAAQLNNLIAGASFSAHRSLTAAEWVKTNCTAAKDQTGIDGAANAASSITATADNATCLYAITVASSTRTFSAFVKRIAGGGRVAITRDGGTTYQDITAQCVIGSFTRVSLTTTAANPTVGFWLEKSGAALAIDAVNDTDTSILYDPLIVRNTDRRADSLVFTSMLPAITPNNRYYMSAEIIVQGTGSSSLLLSNSGATDQWSISVSPTSNFITSFLKVGNALKQNNTTSNQTVKVSLTVGTRLKFGLLFGISQMSVMVNDAVFYNWDGSYISSGIVTADPASLNSLTVSGDADYQNVQINEVIGSNLMLVGDSLTATANYTDLFRNSLNPFDWTVFGRGVGGNVITDVAARLSTDVTPYYWTRANRNVMFLWIGTNTLANNVDATTALGQLQTCVNAMLTAQPGWRIKLITVVPSRSSGLTGLTAAQFTTAANAFNAGLGSIAGIDNVIDITTIPEALDSTSTTYFLDGIHPAPALYNLMKPVFLKNIY